MGAQLCTGIVGPGLRVIGGNYWERFLSGCPGWIPSFCSAGDRGLVARDDPFEGGMVWVVVLPHDLGSKSSCSGTDGISALDFTSRGALCSSLGQRWTGSGKYGVVTWADLRVRVALLGGTPRERRASRV